VKCEVALDHLNDYVEARIDAPMRVVMDHHFRECTACRHELEGARELAALFASLPQVEPPIGFRAAILSRVGGTRNRPATLLHRWGVALGERRASIAGFAAAAALAGILFTAPSFHNSITLGPLPFRISLPHVSSHKPSLSGIPQVLIGGGTSGAPRVGGETVLNLVVQPSADLNNGRVIVPFVSEGLTLANESVPTDRGRVVWQGNLVAGSPLRVSLRFRATRVGVNRVLLYVEGDGRSFQRLVFVPVMPIEPTDDSHGAFGSEASTIDTLRGEWSTSETLARLASRSGAIIATDLSREREQPIEIAPAHLGRAIARIAAQRGMEWSRVDGVYNLYSSSLARP